MTKVLTAGERDNKSDLDKNVSLSPFRSEESLLPEQPMPKELSIRDNVAAGSHTISAHCNQQSVDLMGRLVLEEPRKTFPVYLIEGLSLQYHTKLQL